MVVAVVIALGLLSWAGTLDAALAIRDRPFVQSSGIQLFLNGSAYRFTGVDAYEGATQWSTNAGCGGQLSDAQLDQLFTSMPPNSMIRIWAFQGTIATDKETHRLDWGPLDRVVTAAAAHHQRVILALTDQGGTCDGGHWQDPSWFSGGFRTVYNSPSTTDGKGLTPLSYWMFLQAIVEQFKNAPGLGMWEPISEAEASTCAPQYQPLQCSGHQTCPDEATAASALRYFYDTVGDKIHLLDPRHPVENGLLGGGQCGTQGADYQYVSASPGIDVLSYHDYWGSSLVGGDRWNGLAVRLAQSMALAKPIIAGEAGLNAGSGAGCMTDSTRNRIMVDKKAAQFRGGSSGFLVWNWVPDVSSACSYDVTPDDPLMQSGGAVG
jgi:mannan endo-1,4-beta-mannosidase